MLSSTTIFMLFPTFFACFFQHERSDFSTRALESEKIASLFQLKKRRYLDRKSDAFFLPSFERFRKRVRTRLDISILQQQILSIKFVRKLRLFQLFLLPCFFRKIEIMRLKIPMLQKGQFMRLSVCSFSRLAHQEKLHAFMLSLVSDSISKRHFSL